MNISSPNKIEGCGTFHLSGRGLDMADGNGSNFASTRPLGLGGGVMERMEVPAGDGSSGEEGSFSGSEDGGMAEGGGDIASRVRANTILCMLVSWDFNSFISLQ